MAVDIKSFVTSIFQQYGGDWEARAPIDVKSQSTRTTTDIMGNCDVPVTYSNDLFVKADANHDGSLTFDELAAYVSKFDTNHDGQLDQRGWLARLLPFGKPSEWENFTRQFREVKGLPSNCN